MGKSTFSGPIRTGVDTGRADTTTIGTVVLQQSVTVVASAQRTTAAAKFLVIPPNSDLLDITVRTYVAWTFVTGANVDIGDVDSYISIAKVSCPNSGVYRMGGTNFTLNLQNLHQISNPASAKTIYLKTSASAADPGESVVTIFYAQRK